MSNPYDALKRLIETEANQEHDGGFFATLGGINPGPIKDNPLPKGLFQTWDVERDGQAVKADPRKPGGIGWQVNKGRTTGPHLQCVTFKPKRRPYMIIRRLSTYGGNVGVHHSWAVYCTKCEVAGFDKPLMFARKRTWQTAIVLSNHHARHYH